MTRIRIATLVAVLSLGISSLAAAQWPAGSLDPFAQAQSRNALPTVNGRTQGAAAPARRTSGDRSIEGMSPAEWNTMFNDAIAQATSLQNDPDLDPASRRLMGQVASQLRTAARNGFGGSDPSFGISDQLSFKSDQPDEIRFEGTQHMDMFFESAKRGFSVSSGKEGGHNTGSLHPKGRAVDVKTRKQRAEDIDAFGQDMENLGYRVKDERTRPPGQKVWTGPHLHLSAPMRNEPNYGLGLDLCLPGRACR